MRANICFCEDSGSVFSAVSLRLQNPIPRSHWNRGIWSRGLTETTGFNTPSHWYRRIGSRCFKETMNLTETNDFFQIPGSYLDRWIRSCSLLKTAGSDPAVALKPQEPIPQSHWDRLIRYPVLINKAGSELCNDYFDFLREYRDCFSPWIRAQGGLFDKKNRGSKISWHCPFN
jgi:hypothetical protein